MMSKIIEREVDLNITTEFIGLQVATIILILPQLPLTEFINLIIA